MMNMSKYIKTIELQLVMVLSASILLSSCIVHNKSQSSKSDKIVSLDSGIVAIDSFTNVLDAAISDITSSEQADNLILFIHGRGKHPQKAFKQNILVDLEKDYSAKVIMFHWPSWQGKYAFPVANARNAATDFNRILEQISTYKAQHKDKLKNIKFTLLSNSMGSYVLEQAMITKEHEYKDLFDTILINAAASSAKTHAKWVNKMSMSKDIYITFNTKDKLLDKIGIKLLHKRLGKGLKSIFGDNFTLSNQAKYIDVSQFQLNHRYYLYKDFHNHARLQTFYDAVLNGKSAALDVKHGISKEGSKNIYILNVCK